MFWLSQTHLVSPSESCSTPNAGVFDTSRGLPRSREVLAQKAALNEDSFQEMREPFSVCLVGDGGCL